MKKTILFFSLFIITINNISASFYARGLNNYESWSNAEILKCETKVELYGILYETTINLKVKLGQSYQWGTNQYYCQNPSAGRYEFIWTFSLPQNSFIKGLSVFNNRNNEFVSAGVIDLSSGESSYNPNSFESTNTILRQYMRRDYNGNYNLNYELKISPVNWNESVEFVLKIVSPVGYSYNKRVLDIFTNQFYTQSTTSCYNNAPAKYYVIDYNNINVQPYNFQGNTFVWSKVENFWYTSTTLNNYYLYQISFPSESDNGKFLRTSTLTGNYFYQLSTLPHINYNLRPPRKIIVAFDLMQRNFSDYSRENFFVMLKDALMISTTEKDSIVFVTSDFDVKWLNQNFQQRSESLIQTHMSTIKETIPRLNLLPYMLKDIVKYLNEKNIDAEVWLISDDYQTGVRAETVMELLDHTYFKANKKVIFNIIDASSTGYGYYIQNKYYRGNEYLYENITRLSGGNFSKMYDKYYMYYIDEALDCWAPKISTVEIDPIPKSGFTYSRVNLNNSRNNFHIGARYFQIGMFEGNLPIDVNYFGNYLKNPYFNTIDLPEDETDVPESMTLNIALYWYGNYILKDLFQKIHKKSLNMQMLSLMVCMHIIS